MVYRLFATTNSLAPTILRLLLAVVFAVHGGQKTIGWLGGAGWNSTVAHWTAPAPVGFGFSYGLVAASILAEVGGAAGMLLGFMTRLAATGLFCVKVATILLIDGRVGFFAPAGYEYPLALASMALALVFGGGGKFSVDRLLTRALLPPNSGRLGSYLE